MLLRFKLDDINEFFAKARKPDPRQMGLFGEADVEAHTRQVGGKPVRVTRHKRKVKGRTPAAPKPAPKPEEKPLDYKQIAFLRKVGKLDHPDFVSPGDKPPGGYWRGDEDVAEHYVELGYLVEAPGGGYGLTPKGYRAAATSAAREEEAKKFRIRGLSAFQQERKDRAEDRAARLRAKGVGHYEESERAVAHIPMGQPILRGHHSERRHRRDLARSHAAMRRSIEAHEEAAAAETAARAAGRSISADDPDAIQLLNQDLERMEKTRDLYKKINAAHRKGGWEAVAKVTKQAARMKAAVERASWRSSQKPIESWQLTNLGANIRRVKKRIEELKAEEKKPEAKPIEGKGYSVEEDKDDNRIRMFFDAKPSSQMRTKLKGEGWRWSPKAGAWQRQLTDNARYSMRRMVEHFGSLGG